MDNEDIITEILSRVGGSDFKQLKLVSKGWHDLIATHPCLQPCFDYGHCITYLDPTAQSRQVTFREDGCLENEERLSFFLPADMDVLASCNGLLLIGTPLSVYDPVAHHRIDLPAPCYPNLSLVTVGLAVDSPQSYDVVRVLRDAEDDLCDGANLMYFEVYSSEIGEWRLVEDATATVEISRDAFQDMNGTISRALFMYGALHWIVGGHLVIYRLDDACSSVFQFDYNFVPVMPCLVAMDGQRRLGLAHEAVAGGVEIFELVFHRDPEEQRGHVEYCHIKSLIRHAEIDPVQQKDSELELVGYNDLLEQVYLKVDGQQVVSCPWEEGEGGEGTVQANFVAKLDVCMDKYSFFPFRSSSSKERKRSAEVMYNPLQKRMKV